MTEMHLKAREKLEMELWRTWKLGGERQEDLDKLKLAFQPLLEGRLEKFSLGPVDRKAMYTKMENVLVEALRNFDPTKSHMSVFIVNHLRGVRCVRTAPAGFVRKRTR